MQYSVMGVTGFLASFMQTAWAGERALGGATLIGGELVGIPVDDHGVDSSNNKKDDDTPADTAAVSTHAGLLRHCISEPQPCRVLRNLSTGSGRSASPSSLAPTSSPPAAGSITKPRSLEGNSGWLLLDPDAATAAFGGLTLVGGELHGVAADGDDAITVTITVKKLKGAKAD
ncbi:hypothetical protein HYH02_012106 [Chlamydomonas schloesseri]|uniref:Uncharacterized protein n=1 Tax=Chlamydomonas schloesseri TaxID=2026947 RepID=A0A835W2J1_9CHLO|nr:hypothetical protein HYH02_012106 [Chlamydomonas schloesseri]|eukprot:KAG2434908.1 hypothetical protein HYH02_012106 [Chlamydomonas schloesseri]